MEEIISYIMNTPENTNGNILREKIKDFQKANSIAQPEYTYQAEYDFILDEEFESVDKMSLKDATGVLSESSENIKQNYEDGFIKLNVVTHNGRLVGSFPVTPAFSTCQYAPGVGTFYSHEPFFVEIDPQGFANPNMTFSCPTVIWFYGFTFSPNGASIIHYEVSSGDITAHKFSEHGGSDEGPAHH